MKTSADYCAVFDLDGTVLDTLDDLADSVNHALLKNGFPPRTRSEIRAFVGNGIRNLIKRSLPEGAANEFADTVLADFRAHYALHCSDKTHPYAGMTALLGELREAGIKTALVSNKTDSAVQSLAVQYFDGLFDHVAGEKENVPRKPAPDPVNNALSSLGISRENAVYIGDSEVDVLTAKNAELPCICVLWGFRDEDLLRESGAGLTAHTAAELKEQIKDVLKYK